LNRLLTCYKQRITDLESLWTSTTALEQFLPQNKQIYQITIEDMKWLSFSTYGTITKLNKYFTQFKSSNDMTKQLYSINNQNGQTQYTDVSNQHIQEWLLQNKLQLDEVRSAEFFLNKWIESRDFELVDVRMSKYNGMQINYHPTNTSGLMIVSAGVLQGYFRAANRKRKLYIIAKCTDPAPVQYENAFYLRDAYQQVKDYVQTYPLISKIDEANEKVITYNSQWVIYKICA
jgi:hypothetical protein